MVPSVTNQLADHIQTSFAALAERRVRFRRSDYRLIWTLLDVLEEDYGTERTLAAIDTGCALIPDGSDFRSPGAFLHFLADGIVNNELIIQDKHDDGRGGAQ